jgi:hypothetical protein
MTLANKSIPSPVLSSSLGLQALCQRMQSVVTCGILELGPVRSENLDFWSRFHPSIYIADLRSSLPLPDLSPEDSEFVEPDWDRLLGLPGGRSFDVIFAWDLLNYLELPAVCSLIRYLKRFCRRGTVLFSLIFDQKQMPNEITIYDIKDEAHLNYENTGSEMRVCLRHQPRALALAMTGFRASDSFRLKNGIVEYLFEYEGDAA